MFSRGIIALVVGVGILSCGLRTGESPPDNETLQVGSDQYSCVAHIALKVEQYIDDDLSEQEISTFVRCLQNAFIRFAQLTHGSESNNYRPDELRKFIEKNFLRNKKISDGLLHEFMVIKQVYLGGSTERVSKTDLSAAVDVLEDIRIQAIRMKPHIKVLNLRLLREQDPIDVGVRLRLAQDALQQSIAAISGRLQSSQQLYSFSNLTRFVVEFRAFIDWSQHFPDTKPVSNWVEFIKVFKDLNVSRGDQGIAPKDWKPILDSFSRWYVLALQYDVGVKGRQIISGQPFENTKFLADQVFTLVEDAIRAQPNLLISFKQLNRLVNAIGALDLLPEGLRAESVMELTETLLTRVFGDTSLAPELRQSKGLSMVTVANIASEVYRWVYIQMNLNQVHGQSRAIFNYNNSDKVPELSAEIVSKQILPKVGWQNAVVEHDSSEWDDFMQVQTKLRPLFRADLPKVFLVHQELLQGYGVTHGYYDLSALNFERALVNLVFKGYSNSPSPTWDSQITEDQLQKFYEDIRDIGIDFEFIDKRKFINKRLDETGKRAFLEGSAFTYSADGVQKNPKGDSVMSLTETVELLSFMYTGSQFSNEVYNYLSTACPKTERHPERPSDLYGHPKLSRSCVELNFSQAILHVADNMPELVKYLKALTDEQRLAFGKNLLDASFDPDPKISDRLWIESAEITVSVVVLHYQEVAMTRYDQNHDGFLDVGDVDVAAVTLSGLFDKMAEKEGKPAQSEARKVAGLKYILAYQEIPGAWWEKLWVVGLDWTIGFPVKVDRMALGEVFEILIQKILAPPPVKKTCGRRGVCP